MPSFQLVGLPAEPFQAMFDLTDAELSKLNAKRVIATERPGSPCRVSLDDADVGEELLLLSYAHQPAASPYQASGPIFVRKGAAQRVLAVNELPEYVTSRLVSLRAYDADHMITIADVHEGRHVAAAIEESFSDARVRYIHLHYARRGCFACLVQRAPEPPAV